MRVLRLVIFLWLVLVVVGVVFKHQRQWLEWRLPSDAAESAHLAGEPLFDGRLATVATARMLAALREMIVERAQRVLYAAARADIAGGTAEAENKKRKSA